MRMYFVPSVFLMNSVCCTPLHDKDEITLWSFVTYVHYAKYVHYANEKFMKTIS